jgi:glycosyltransferase involved in cell wall biosynthesis
VISVFTPTFNIGSVLERPFQSLINQTYTDWEWIVYDDSTDSTTWEYIQRLALLDSRVKPFKADQHSGFVGYTKLQACNLATGDILVELDHDDRFTPSCLEKIRWAFTQYPEAGFAYSHFVELEERNLESFSYGDGFACGFGAHYYSLYYSRWVLVCIQPPINPHSLTHIVGVPNHVRAWRKSTYNKTGGHNPELRVADDYDLLIRTANLTSFIHIPEILYFQYRREAPFENTQSLYNKEIQSNVKVCLNKYRDLSIFENGDSYFSIHTREEPYWSNHEVAKTSTITPLQKGKVSVIIPTYNRPGLLKAAINSVTCQSYTNWEIIIVGDDCPTLNHFMQDFKHPLVKWWNLESHYNDGGTTPRNYALKMLATGEYIAYLDDDNTWKYNHLNSLINSMTENNSDYAISSMVMDDITIYCPEPKLYRVDSSALLHKKELLEKYGYWKTREQAGYSHDWELVSRWKDHLWSATLLPTLNYNTEAGQNDAITIKEVYDDQNI